MKREIINAYVENSRFTSKVVQLAIVKAVVQRSSQALYY